MKAEIIGCCALIALATYPQLVSAADDVQEKPASEARVQNRIFAGSGDVNPQGNADGAPKSMQDERRPASTGEDDLDVGNPTADGGRRDTNDSDERPLTNDSARPSPREADSMEESNGAPTEEMGQPRGQDVEGRRGPASPVGAPPAE